MTIHDSERRGKAPSFRRFIAPTAATLLFAASVALGADVRPGWGSWWLPPNRSTHGGEIDALFNLIFWITTITFIVVQVLLIVFLVKYRARPDRKKGVFSHGNTRLEMAWTLAPALILALLALFSKRVWDNYRYSPYMEDPNRTTILVFGERFKWNTIYPGPDGILGRYLIFPEPYDATWPNGQNFRGVPGPASLPYKEALAAISAYNNEGINIYGKDFSDPAGKDDVWEQAQARPIVIPVNRPVEVQLGSKDVLHDFFLPNFRVKLDAVPGMRGKIYFTATMTSKQLEEDTVKNYRLEELPVVLKSAQGKELVLRINESSPGTDANKNKDKTGWRYINPNDPKKGTIIRDGKGIPESQIESVVQKLKEAGVTEITLFAPGYWELVCEELCGEGHGEMKGLLFVVSQEEYDAMKLDKPAGARSPTDPTTAPSIAMTTSK